MDINTMFQLMVAASLEGCRPLHVTDRVSCDQLMRMAAAGLVDVTIHGELPNRTVTVRRLTARGGRLLRAYASPKRTRPAGAVRRKKLRKVSRRAAAPAANLLPLVPPLIFSKNGSTYESRTP